MLQNLLGSLLPCLTVGFIMLAFIVVVLMAAKSQVVVNEGEAKTVTFEGKYRRVLGPGLNFLIPGLEQVDKVVPLQQLHFKIAKRAFLISTSQPVQFGLSVHYQIRRDPRDPHHQVPDPDAVYRALYTVADWQERTREEAEAAATIVVSNLKGENVKQHADFVHWLGNEIRDELDTRAESWGVYIADVNLLDYEVTDALRQAVFRDFINERKADDKRREARIQKEQADIRGLDTEQMIRWHQTEVLAEAMKASQGAVYMNPQVLNNANPAPVPTARRLRAPRQATTANNEQQTTAIPNENFRAEAAPNNPPPAQGESKPAAQGNTGQVIRPVRIREDSEI